MTNPDTRKRIPIPKDLQPGDVLVTRDGHRCVFCERGVNVYTHSTSPGVFTADGRSWSEPRNRMWDVVAIERRPKPVRDDKDAVWLMHLINYPEFTVSKSRTSRLRAIARRLNGGKEVGP